MAYLFYAALAFVVYKMVTDGAKKGASTKPRKRVKGSKIKPPHEVLGVERDATEHDIRRAYQAKMREYHPDKVANAADELKSLAEKRSKEINAAYATMMKKVAS